MSLRPGLHLDNYMDFYFFHFQFSETLLYLLCSFCFVCLFWIAGFIFIVISRNKYSCRSFVILQHWINLHQEKVNKKLSQSATAISKANNSVSTHAVHESLLMNVYRNWFLINFCNIVLGFRKVRKNKMNFLHTYCMLALQSIVHVHKWWYCCPLEYNLLHIHTALLNLQKTLPCIDELWLHERFLEAHCMNPSFLWGTKKPVITSRLTKVVRKWFVCVGSGRLTLTDRQRAPGSTSTPGPTVAFAFISIVTLYQNRVPFFVPTVFCFIIFPMRYCWGEAGILIWRR